MPYYLIKRVLTLLCFAATLSGCVNLRHISEFSETSIEGIERFESLSPNFLKTCLEDCERKHIAKLQIHNTSCDCAQDEIADNVTLSIYNALQGYFYGLTDIANNELTNYQTSGVIDAVTTGDFGSIRVNEADVKAYSNVITIIGRAFTDGYRRNKIKEYLTRANEPVQVLVHFLDLNLSGNLKGKLEVQKSMLKKRYFDLVRDKKLSIYERTKFAEDYFKRISEIEAKQQELDSYSEVLKTISEGHQTLYSNSNGLAEDEVRAQLAVYGSKLRQGITLLNKQQ